MSGWRLLTVVTAFVLSLQPGWASSHAEGPMGGGDRRGNISDHFAFVNPNNPNNVVLACPVCPYSVPGTDEHFASDVLYQFKIDNTGDLREDLVIQATFSPPGPNQQITLVGPVAPPRGFVGTINQVLGGARRGRVPSVTGPANGTVINGPGGMRVFAGLRDDPFFADFVWIRRFLGLSPGGPPSREPGLDFQAGLNVCMIAVEVPVAALRGSRSSVIRAWATTSRSRPIARWLGGGAQSSEPLVQMERCARPLTSDLLLSDAVKEEYLRSGPADDRRRFRAAVIARLVAINNDRAYSEQVADILLPNVVTLDLSQPGGYPNGRRPQDDVADAVLALITKAAVATDRVNGNDVPFLSDFPFFAPEHQPGEPIPPRG